MDSKFWLDRWKNNIIGFHRSDVNPLLREHFHLLELPQGSRIFLPLCGKTLDIGWLLSQGYRVVGAELSEMAIQQLFAELKMTPEIIKVGSLIHYKSKNIDIFVGDLFNLTSELLGPVDAIYDRAALVALPEEMRLKYTSHLIQITSGAPQLLITYEYDQSVIPGPPFSVSTKEVKEHYANQYKVNHIVRLAVPGGMKGLCPATESVYLLK